MVIPETNEIMNFTLSLTHPVHVQSVELDRPYGLEYGLDLFQQREHRRPPGGQIFRLG